MSLIMRAKIEDNVITSRRPVMIQKYGKGQFQVDYEARIDFNRLRSERVRRTQEAMRKSGTDVLLLWKDENIRYLTSLRAIMIQYRSTTTYGVLLFVEGEPTLLASGGEFSRAKEAMPWIKDMVAIPILDEPGLVQTIVQKEIIQRIADKGLTRGRIGVDGMTFSQMRAYQTGLSKAELVDGDTLMQKVRLIKTEDEVQLLHEACAIGDAVTQTAIDYAHPGRRECEVAGEAMRTLFTLGGEFAHLASPFVASGERMSPPTRFATDKIIRNGDIVFIDIGACWNGYFGDVGRAVICGKPSDVQKRIYTSVYEALQAGIEKMRPGNTNEDIARAIRNKVAKHGLEKNFINLFIGHGIGISPNEPPYIGEQTPGAEEVVLEKGMVFAVEPLIWVPDVRGGGGIRLEDTILITEKEALALTRAPFDDRLLV
jgi:Xaa-Pro aminopeptidase